MSLCQVLPRECPAKFGEFLQRVFAAKNVKLSAFTLELKA